MSEIRAFVGHSYSEDDDAIVNAFLRYFDKLSNLLPNFSWEHAESAEPRQLAEKVLQRIDGKNLFIGICTRKEYAIPPTSLRSLFLVPQYLWIGRSEAAWKTSDWIIQEIGLAKGRNLPLVLLIEDGVRPPGGLQGDVEYIPFDRRSPEKSHIKIMDMIAALTPRIAEASIASSDIKSSSAETKQAQPPADKDWTKPNPDWIRRDYEFAIMHMMIQKNEDGVDAITKAYLATDDAVKDDNVVSWNAYVEWIRIFWGHNANFPKLRSLAKDQPRSARVLKYYARALREYEKHEEAASYFQAAAREAKTEIESLQLLGQAAVSFAKAKVVPSKLSVIAEMRRLAQATTDGEAEFLRSIKEIAETEDDHAKALGAMERMIDIEPSDTNLRFSLAYKHSEEGDRDLALHHYAAVPAHARTAMIWNNLGVALQGSSLPGKAIEAYRHAEQMGETLAMSNLANKLIASGFLPEAQQICDRAIQEKDCDKNVALTLGRLKEIPEEEKEKEAEILERAKPKERFYSRFGSALMRIFPAAISETWNGPDCPLTVRVDGTTFLATGKYVRASLGLMVPDAYSTHGVQHTVEYKGTVFGSTIQGTIIKGSEGRRTALSLDYGSLLNPTNEGTKFLMILSDSQRELEVLELPDGRSSSLYRLVAIVPALSHGELQGEDRPTPQS